MFAGLLKPVFEECTQTSSHCVILVLPFRIQSKLHEASLIQELHSTDLPFKEHWNWFFAPQTAGEMLYLSEKCSSKRLQPTHRALRSAWDIQEGSRKLKKVFNPTLNLVAAKTVFNSGFFCYFFSLQTLERKSAVCSGANRKQELRSVLFLKKIFFHTLLSVFLPTFPFKKPLKRIMLVWH